MKTKYIIVVEQDADIDYSEDIKEALEFDIHMGGRAPLSIESVEIVEE